MATPSYDADISSSDLTWGNGSGGLYKLEDRKGIGEGEVQKGEWTGGKGGERWNGRRGEVVFFK